MGIVALVNDTTGTLITSCYRDPLVKIGSVFSTGCNAVYMETVQCIPKVRGIMAASDDAMVVINTEYGAFDNSHKVLPRTRFDDAIDAASTRPGQQAYEKMISGCYVGEILHEFSWNFINLFSSLMIRTSPGSTCPILLMRHSCPLQNKILQTRSQECARK